MIKIIGRLLIFIFLTILTQVGGIAYLLGVWIDSKLKLKANLRPVTWTLLVYLMFTFLLIPFVGREKLKNTNKIKPVNFMTILLNRNYVTPKMNLLLQNTENNLANTSIEIRYLDANFPFINKFPLLPHLSHNDGKKIDISFVYENSEGMAQNKSKSVSGYGVFAEPKKTESNQTTICKNNGYFQYDYPNFLTLGSINDDLKFSEKGTRLLIISILKNSSLEKIFIEPHLKSRMKLSDNRIRFQGCRAVRHDDHIHIQVK